MKQLFIDFIGNDGNDDSKFVPAVGDPARDCELCNHESPCPGDSNVDPAGTAPPESGCPPL